MSSDKPETEAKPKKGKGMLVKLIAGIALIGAGGGGVFGLIQAGVIGGGGHEAKEDNNPKLVRKGEEDPFAPKAAGEKEGEGLPEVDGEGGSAYRTSYYSFAEDFTSNLRNSDALVQVSLAASTHRDGRVLMWIKKHELAIRSGMLTVLADTPEEDVYTLEGKVRLQKRLTAAINHVLVQNEGFGGIDNVYFKTFIIQ
ncbi:MAG: flagellar basal body-associated FliL family protein [Novosphingobium sp.]|jgi:flagellar FliL protein|nr:flagellar basal body-associated FliL family protein [Novosphingobium sp.]